MTFPGVLMKPLMRSENETITLSENLAECTALADLRTFSCHAAKYKLFT